MTLHECIFRTNAPKRLATLCCGIWQTWYAIKNGTNWNSDVKSSYVRICKTLSIVTQFAALIWFANRADSRAEKNGCLCRFEAQNIRDRKEHCESRRRGQNKFCETQRVKNIKTPSMTPNSLFSTLDYLYIKGNVSFLNIKLESIIQPKFQSLNTASLQKKTGKTLYPKL